MNKSLKAWAGAMALVYAVSISAPALAEGASNASEKPPSAMAMLIDLVAIRPVFAAITVGGTGLWVATLPFTALGGNVAQAGDTLVAKPAMNTFVRCLGCTNWGHKGEEL